MTRTFIHRAPLAAVILCIAVFSHAAVDDLTDVVPAGAPVVAYIADVPGTMDQWAASPLAELWNDPQVRRFFAPLRGEIDIDRWNEVVREETGFSMNEIKEMFTGDLVVFIDDLEVVLEEGEEDLDFSMTVLAAVGENAEKAEKLILEQEAKVAADEDADDDGEGDSSYEIREFRGIDLHIESEFSSDEIIDEVGWAIVDGVLAVASPVDSLERAVAGILDGGVDDSLRSGTNFATTTKHIRSADSWFFMDVDPWLPLLRAAMTEGLAAAQEAGNPFPVDQTTLMDALGIEAMQALFASFDFDGRIMDMNFGATYTENSGLMKLIAYGPGEAPRLTYIPLDSDSFTTATFNFQSSWSAMVDIMNGINPALMGMAAMQLQSMAQNAGAQLDLRRDLLDNLTGEMASIQNLEGVIGDTFAELKLEQDQVVALGIHQHEALENVIETIKGMVGQGSEFFTKRDFEGHTIFTLDIPQAEGKRPGNEIAYVITDGHLLISMGTPATLEKVLLKLGDTKNSVWKLPEVRRAVGRLPDGAAAIQYQDLRSIGDLAFHAIAIADRLHAEDGEDFRICDPSAIPDAGMVGRYFAAGVSGVWKDDRSLLIRALVLPAGKE